MTKPYPIELRERAVRFVNAGECVWAWNIGSDADLMVLSQILLRVTK